MNNSFLITANWKLNGNKQSIKKYLKLLNSFLLKKSYPCKIIFTPSCIYLNYSKKYITCNNLYLGAQNVSNQLRGAFTGEISIYMLKDIGIKYVIIGHSERRMHYQENDTVIAKKFRLIKENGLIPILCLGETYEQKISNQTEKVCKKQINKIINTCGSSAFEDAIIAYEPIWSIGSGKLAKPREIQKIHKFIKNYIKYKSVNFKLSKIIVQYGGSINEKNIQSFLKEQDIDGILVGGASLDFYQFSKIISLANTV